MYENRSITAVIIGAVSLLLIGAAWFYLGRQSNSAAGQNPARRSDPYSSYYRDAGQIADSLVTPNPAPAPAPAMGTTTPSGSSPGQPIPAPPASPQAAPEQPVPGQPIPGQSIPAQPGPGLVPAAPSGFQPAAAPATPPTALPGALPPDIPPPTMLRR